MDNYKPGLYAVTSWRGERQMAFRTNRGGDLRWVVLDLDDTRGLRDDEVTEARPLVALDLDDPAAAVAYLKVATDGFDKAAYGMEAWAGREPLRQIAKQIKAQTTPPRIPEPGLWAVVEASTAHLSRRKFVRHERMGGSYGYHWIPATTGIYVPWSELVDPVLIREGVDA